MITPSMIVATAIQIRWFINGAQDEKSTPDVRASYTWIISLFYALECAVMKSSGIQAPTGSLIDSLQSTARKYRAWRRAHRVWWFVLITLIANLMLEVCLFRSLMQEQTYLIPLSLMIGIGLIAYRLYPVYPKPRLVETERFVLVFKLYLDHLNDYTEDEGSLSPIALSDGSEDGYHEMIDHLIHIITGGMKCVYQAVLSDRHHDQRSTEVFGDAIKTLSLCGIYPRGPKARNDLQHYTQEVRQLMWELYILIRVREDQKG